MSTILRGTRRRGTLKLLDQFPPIASDDLSSAEFGKYYEGSNAIERRIRACLSARAVTQFQFWWVPIVAVCLSVAMAIFEVPRRPGIGAVAIAFFLVVGISQPIGMLWDVRKTAKFYSRPSEVFAAHFGTFAFLWKIPGKVFSVGFALVKKMFLGSSVVVLTLSESTASCVLPLELLSQDDIATLRASVARNASKQLE